MCGEEPSQPRCAGLSLARLWALDALELRTREHAPGAMPLTRTTLACARTPTQARRQLEDLVDVWAVTDYSHLETIKRELLMIKVGTVPEELQASDGRANPAHPGWRVGSGTAPVVCHCRTRGSFGANA